MKWKLVCCALLLAWIMPQAVPLMAATDTTTVTGTVPLVTYEVSTSHITSHGATIVWKTNGLLIDFQPSRATFEPPITLECSYDPADIPEGIAEKDLAFAYYDEEASEWVQLEDCVVDPEADTITAPVSHLTAFGIMVFIPAPAAFTFSALEISPAEVEIGDTITISALVENTGEKLGVLRATLNINGKAEEVKYLTLEPGARTRVSFTTSRDVAGSYSVEVNGLTSSFTVKAPPPPPELPPPEEVPPPAKVNWPLIGVIAAVVIAGLVAFFLVRRRLIKK